MSGEVSKLERRREDVRATAEALLMRAQSQGRQKLNDDEELEYCGLADTIKGLSERIADTRSELKRVGSHPLLSSQQSRQPGSAGRLAPLAFSDDQLRRAHARLANGEAVMLETRDFNTAVDLLPSQLFSPPTFPRHEDRLVDKLPGIQLEAPSLEYVQVNAVTGNAAIVGEGEPKPEIMMPPTPKVCTALKLACHSGVSWENVSDFDAFTQAVRNELMKKIIDLENEQIVHGDPATGGLDGMLTTPGILTFVASGTAATNFDDIAGAISKMRTGPALAVPDLLLLHPDTWANIRTQKDLQGRYYVAADPSTDQVEQVWGVPVVQSTQFTPGEGVLLDSRLFGRVAVRESLALRLGFSGDDFVRNIIRSVAEERLNLAVERPAAICRITGLPTAAPLQEESTTKASTTKTTAKSSSK